jgi:hypothetical protein
VDALSEVLSSVRLKSTQGAAPWACRHVKPRSCEIGVEGSFSLRDERKLLAVRRQTLRAAHRPIGRRSRRAPLGARPHAARSTAERGDDGTGPWLA